MLEYQEQARGAALQAFIDQSASISSPQDVHVRGAIPSSDLDANDETAETTVVDGDAEVWETTIGTDEDDEFNGWYAVDDREDAEDIGVAVYGLQYLGDAGEMPIEWVRVRNRTGGLIDQYDLGSIELGDGPVDNTLLIENPLVVGTRSLFFEVYSTEADTTVPFKPLVAVAEEEGDTFEDADRFIA